MAADKQVARRSRALAQLQRDGALKRLSAARKWTLAGAAAATAGVSALVSEVAPGHSLSARSRVRTAKATATKRPVTSPKMPPLASAAELGLQGPAAAPQPAPAPTPQVAPSQPDPSQAAPVPAPAPPAPDTSATGGGGGGAVVSGGS